MDLGRTAKDVRPCPGSRSVKKSGKEFFQEEPLLELTLVRLTGQEEGEPGSTQQTSHRQGFQQPTGHWGQSRGKQGPAASWGPVMKTRKPSPESPGPHLKLLRK